MERKRTSEEKRRHLLEKIRKLESQIVNLSDSECEGGEERNEIEEVEIENNPIVGRADDSRPEEELYEVLLEEEDKEDALDEEVLDILGLAPAPTPKKETLHKDIAERWTDILVKGLKKEEKETINKDNPPFENVGKMVAPKLNKEVAVALNENAKKRDLLIENRQKQISTALVCIGQALQMSLGRIQEQKLKIIKKMNEAGRLLCDSLHLDSKGRRNLVLSVINKDLKDFLLETESSEFLFGENLTEKIKTAKAVQKSGKDLKIPAVDDKKKNFIKRTEATEKKQYNQSLNWRGPPRVGAQQRFQRSGGPTFNHSNRQQMVKKNEDKGVSKRGRK